MEVCHDHELETSMSICTGISGYQTQSQTLIRSIQSQQRAERQRIKSKTPWRWLTSAPASANYNISFLHCNWRQWKHASAHSYRYLSNIRLICDWPTMNSIVQCIRRGLVGHACLYAYMGWHTSTRTVCMLVHSGTAIATAMHMRATNYICIWPR